MQLPPSYRGQADSGTKLAAKLAKGGNGVWGSVPMAPQPKVSAADSQAIIAWILSLK